MEEQRINWNRLHTFYHGKRATNHQNTGNTDRKHSIVYLTARESIINYINKLPDGDISLAKTGKDLDIDINWVTEVMTDLSTKHKLQGLDFIRGTSGVRCFFKNHRTPKELKYDKSMFRSTYKLKIDHNLKRYIKSMGL